jgi:hypothetical protein
LIVASPIGPIVFGGDKPERWSNGLYDGKPLSDCVVSDGASAIACIQDNRLLFVPRATATP